MTDKQPTFRELRKEGERLGIVTLTSASQSKEQLAQEITAARLKDAVAQRGANNE